MTTRDNRRCQRVNARRDKSRRGAPLQTYQRRQPPSRAAPGAWGRIVSKPCLLNSHRFVAKRVRTVPLSRRADPKHDHSPTARTAPPHTSQPRASQPDCLVTSLKGACAWARACLKGRFWRRGSPPAAEVTAVYIQPEGGDLCFQKRKQAWNSSSSFTFIELIANRKYRLVFITLAFSLSLKRRFWCLIPWSGFPMLLTTVYMRLYFSY